MLYFFHTLMENYYTEKLWASKTNRYSIIFFVVDAYIYEAYNSFSRFRYDYKCTHKMNIYCSYYSYLLFAILFAQHTIWMCVSIICFFSTRTSIIYIRVLFMDCFFRLFSMNVNVYMLNILKVPPFIASHCNFRSVLPFQW